MCFFIPVFHKEHTQKKEISLTWHNEGSKFILSLKIVNELILIMRDYKSIAAVSQRSVVSVRDASRINRNSF